MPAFSILSLALVVACLSGVNCYLTVFLAGLAVKLGWLPPETGAFLSHPAVMWMAAVLYLLETVADKIPGVDSLWDGLQTVIRPAVAVLLALHLMANADPVYQALAGVLAGLAGLTMHLAKASARLSINNEPGPLANILVSIGEDVGVAGIFVLGVFHPVTGFSVCLTLLLTLGALFPRMFRSARASLFFLWKKMRLPAGGMSDEVKLDTKVSAEEDMLIHSALSGACEVQWAVRCVTGRVRRWAHLPGQIFGVLVSVKEHPERLVFIGRWWFRHRAAVVPLAGCNVQHENAFLSENVVVYNKPEKKQATFRFTREEAVLAEKVEEEVYSQRRRVWGTFEPVKDVTLAGVEMTSPALPANAATPAKKPEAPVTFNPEAVPLFVETAAPTAILPGPVAMEMNVPVELIRPFPAAESTESAESPAAGPVPVIADVPPMPALTDDAARTEEAGVPDKVGV